MWARGQEIVADGVVDAMTPIDVDSSIRLRRPLPVDAKDGGDDGVWRYWTQHAVLTALISTLTVLGCFFCIYVRWYWSRRKARYEAEKSPAEVQEAPEHRDIVVEQAQLVLRVANPDQLELQHEEGSRTGSEDEEENAPEPWTGLDLMVYGKPATLKDTAPGPPMVKYSKAPKFS